MKDDLFGRRGPRFWWEYRKLVLHEWWLRVILRRPPVGDNED